MGDFTLLNCVVISGNRELRVRMDEWGAPGEFRDYIERRQMVRDESLIALVRRTELV